jgi:hypothetical protein
VCGVGFKLFSMVGRIAQILAAASTIPIHFVFRTAFTVCESHCHCNSTTSADDSAEVEEFVGVAAKESDLSSLSLGLASSVLGSLVTLLLARVESQPARRRAVEKYVGPSREPRHGQIHV